MILTVRPMNRNCGENGCPYCHEGWGCRHEFIVTEDGYIVGDFKPEIYDYLLEYIEARFDELRGSNHPAPEWTTPWVSDLWKTASEYTPPGNAVSVHNLVGEQEVVRILCDLASELPQTSSDRSMTRDDTPGLTGIGEDFFCEDTEVATNTIKQMIVEALAPRTIGPNKRMESND
ncbi:hypothetical protein N9085_03545 [Akkermansiaceae bacterium]|nr:hypothetical protein [Akkermansiaceae bacterium]